MDHKWDTLVNQYIPLRKHTKKLKTDSNHGSQVGYTG